VERSGFINLVKCNYPRRNRLRFGIKTECQSTKLVSGVLKTYCQIIPITAEIAHHSGELRGRLRTQGKPRTQADMLIAATAHLHQLTLVTRNTRDFEDCGISLLNPFT
jgi:predicted nucleic acid-binding protein